MPYLPIFITLFLQFCDPGTYARQHRQVLDILVDYPAEKPTA